MAPAVLRDSSANLSPRFSPPKSGNPRHQRTLLLAPPSIASHEEKLRRVLSAHDRAVTDLQMLDRLAAGLVKLPPSTYDIILLLADADGSCNESTMFLDRDVFGKIVQTLRAGGRLQSQDGSLGQDNGSPTNTEAILAGLVPSGSEGVIKPESGAGDAVPLQFGKKKDDGSAMSNAGQAFPTTAPASSFSRFAPNGKPAGVGFVGFGDDFGTPVTMGEDDDDLIDEDTLLTEEDLNTPVAIPAACIPRVGKRRRACKDCTCGLAERIAAEDASKRAAADRNLMALKLGADDLAELDFTVQGKVGSCGNCSLGDAFRCDGCPYIGLPAFKPGEEVRLLNNDTQL